MAVARTLVGQDDSTLEAGTSSPQEAKARELGLDPLFSPEQRPHTVAAFAAAPRFILLDFRCAAVADTITSLLHLRAQCTTPNQLRKVGVAVGGIAQTYALPACLKIESAADSHEA